MAPWISRGQGNGGLFESGGRWGRLQREMWQLQAEVFLQECLWGETGVISRGPHQKA